MGIWTEGVVQKGGSMLLPGIQVHTSGCTHVLMAKINRDMRDLVGLLALKSAVHNGIYDW